MPRRRRLELVLTGNSARQVLESVKVQLVRIIFWRPWIFFHAPRLRGRSAVHSFEYIFCSVLFQSFELGMYLQ